MASGEPPPLEACEYLHRGRCTFPDDLRPFGCTTFLCGPMYANLPDETLRRLRRLIRQLDDAHIGSIACFAGWGKDAGGGVGTGLDRTVCFSARYVPYIETDKRALLANNTPPPIGYFFSSWWIAADCGRRIAAASLGNDL